jgi:hypothetical protein
MTCKGYDPKAVKLPKAIKRRATRILDNHKRGAYITSFVKVLEADLRMNKRKKDDKPV